MRNTDFAIIIRSALDVSKYDAINESPVTTGKSRLMNYIWGLSRIKEISKDFPDLDIYWIDNTIGNKEQIPSEISKLFENNWSIITSNTNKYGIYNKGAGDIETLNSMTPTLRNYKKVLIFESRLLLEKKNKLKKIIQRKNEFVALENKNLLDWLLLKRSKTIATGCFCISTDKLITFLNQVDLDKMIRNKDSIESMFFTFCDKNCHKIIKKWFWHSYRIIPGQTKREKY